MPQSRFTRYLIDYVGDGHYQLSAQGKLGQMLPMAKSSDPQWLMKLAMTSPLRGDEVVVSPLAGLVQVISTPVPALTELEARGIDPFQMVGAVLVANRKPNRNPTRPPHGSAAAAQQDADGQAQESAGASESSRKKRPKVTKATKATKTIRVYGLTLRTAPVELRQALEQDRMSGGRLGWLFRDDGDAGAGPSACEN